VNKNIAGARVNGSVGWTCDYYARVDHDEPSGVWRDVFALDREDRFALIRISKNALVFRFQNDPVD
jgi:hypothetical protein